MHRHMYKTILTAFISDGEISPVENMELANARDEHMITDEMHDEILIEVGIPACLLACSTVPIPPRYCIRTLRMLAGVVPACVCVCLAPALGDRRAHRLANKFFSFKPK